MSKQRITTDQFGEFLEANPGTSVREAAKKLGIDERNAWRKWARVKARRAQDPSRLITAPLEPPPPGQLLKGTSTLVGPDGTMHAQWIKTNYDAEQQKAAVEAAIKVLCEKIAPLPIIPEPIHTGAQEELANLYTITDYHVGMLAWKKETGEAWDLQIAEACIERAFSDMLARSPNSKVGIINQLGDFLHFDSLKSITPEHQNLLDSDSRYQHVVGVAIRILRKVVEAALRKHAEVRVYMHEGNHDPAGSVWLRMMFAELYKDNPRVYVEKSPLPYVAYLFGKTLLCFHHGHLAKNESLPAVFAGRFRKEWGAATQTYVHTGHRHSQEVKEFPGAVVEQHSTLAASDAYAARGGWLSRRQATAITYHLDRGEVSRIIVVPEGVDVFGR